MESRRGLRPYQERIVAQAGPDGAHIVVPECAGGPVVGVELIRRLGHPAVVFAPTAAAQLCWQDVLARFTDPPVLTTLDPRVPAPITLLSYHDLQTPEAASTLPADPGCSLPAMTRLLVETLVAHSVRVVVLDGCDQLREGWAVALRYLVDRITVENGPPTVIGLSDVPHDVPEAHRLCRRLVGGHDVSPPAPVLVYEGAITPYRDLVSFVSAVPEKARAAAELLAREHAARPTQLRAVVLTEQEAHGPDVLQALLAEEHAARLYPVLVTPDGLVVESSRAEDLRISAAALLHRLKLEVSCRIAESTMPGVDVLVGEGRDWSARMVATLGAWLLDDGTTRCLVSAAEDAASLVSDLPAVDTFVDLTSRPTAIAAKLRGRVLSFDKSRPDKVAHVWHVVASDQEGAHNEVRWFVERLQDRWGLALTEPRGRVVRGAAALDYTLASGAFDAVDYRRLTTQCLGEIGDREACRQQWARRTRANIGAVASIDAAQAARPTGRWGLVARLALPVLLTVAPVALLVLATPMLYQYHVTGWRWRAAQGAGLVLVALATMSAWRAWRVLKPARGSVQSRLLMHGHAVVDALRDSGHLSPHLSPNSVWVRLAEQRYELALQGGSRRDAQVFATAVAETLSPPRGQRHVVAAGSRAVPVPSIVSDPELFLQAWRHHGGVGRLADGPPASSRTGAIAFELGDTDLPRSLAARHQASAHARPDRRSGAVSPSGEPAWAAPSEPRLGGHDQAGVEDLARVGGDHRTDS
jgi:hypothetical protein